MNFGQLERVRFKSKSKSRSFLSFIFPFPILFDHVVLVYSEKRKTCKISDIKNLNSHQQSVSITDFSESSRIFFKLPSGSHSTVVPVVQDLCGSASTSPFMDFFPHRYIRIPNPGRCIMMSSVSKASEENLVFASSHSYDIICTWELLWISVPIN